MDLSFLKDLLPVMRICNVSAFKCEGLEITFNVEGPKIPASVAQEFLSSQRSTAAPNPGGPETKMPEPTNSEPAMKPETSEPTAQAQGLPTEKVNDVVVTQSLDEELSYEKIRDWSVGADEHGVPLTGDEVVNA
jgi:hypothetical protein